MQGEGHPPSPLHMLLFFFSPSWLTLCHPRSIVMQGEGHSPSPLSILLFFFFWLTFRHPRSISMKQNITRSERYKDNMQVCPSCARLRAAGPSRAVLRAAECQSLILAGAGVRRLRAAGCPFVFGRRLESGGGERLRPLHSGVGVRLGDWFHTDRPMGDYACLH
jgi:hypothetical protein